MSTYIYMYMRIHTYTHIYTCIHKYTNRQFGFREGRSWATNLICFYSRVVDIRQERHGWADCVYLDLEKAFDKVRHKRLIWKRNPVGGMRGPILGWFIDSDKRRNESGDWKQ